MYFCSRKSILLLLIRFVPFVQSASFLQNMSTPSQTCTIQDDAHSLLQTHVALKSVPLVRDPYDALTANQTRLHEDYTSKTKGNRNRSLPEIVSKAFYINLAQDFVRRESMEAQLINLQQETGLPYERFNAVNASTDQQVQTKLQNALGAKFDAIDTSDKGLAGCYASHLRLWKQIFANLSQSSLLSKDSSPEYALVLEDDAFVHPHALDLLDTQLACVPNDVDILLLNFWGSKRQEDKVGERCYRATAPFAEVCQGGCTMKKRFFYSGMHAYLIRLVRLPTLIKHLEDEKNCRNSTAGTIQLSPDVCTTFNALTCRKYALFPGTLGHRMTLEAFGGIKHSES